MRIGGEDIPRRVHLLGVGLALVALGLVFTDWMLTPPPGVTAANVERIWPGMTVEAVAVIFGREVPGGLPLGEAELCLAYRGGEGRAFVYLIVTAE
jgi:hypothetical protein